MKILRSHYLFIALTLITALSACHKDKNNPTPDKPTAQRAGVYILNQGGFNDNGSLTYYDYTTQTLTADIFKQANGRSLGVLPNDIKIYGSKMYITVDKSGVLEVVNPKTAKSIKKILMRTAADTSVSREPRSIVFNKNKAFISEYDGTIAVLDTATLTIDQYITVGRNPEQMAISNGKLYVANSGGLSFGNPDTTVSVIDLVTLTEIKRITVAPSPISVGADAFGNVYVFSAGVFGVTPGGMAVINSATDQIRSQSATTGAYGTSIVTSGDFAYFLTTTTGLDANVSVFNVKTQTLTDNHFITDGTVITLPYNLTYDGNTGELFVSDAKDYTSNGAFFAFDKDGKKEYSITTGINPGAFAFVNK